MDQPVDNSGYTVKLDVFEGPLDLLLHLIRKHEIDIFDIPISFITHKYLEYLDVMSNLNLSMGAEYLDMASYLALVKSKMMLPAEKNDDDLEFEDGPDPREELVRRLLEYQKYKTAANELASRPRYGVDTFTSGASEKVVSDRDLANPGLFSLVEAFQRILKKIEPEKAQEISITRVSISDRIQQVVDLIRTKKRVTFASLFQHDRTKAALVVTFMAVLEMTKLGLTSVHQAGPLGDLYITAKEGIEDGGENPLENEETELEEE